HGIACYGQVNNIIIQLCKQQKVHVGLEEVLGGGGIGFGRMLSPGQGEYGDKYWEESREHFVR
ncbi:MAG: hypothetical protein ACKPKO_13800, partial [Candidatus Fonsibacter sp.]